MRSIYVETFIRADLDDLWRLTQEPAQHQRWDLRFTTIDYQPRRGPEEPQRFRYATRVLPGLVIDGVGVTTGERRRPDGTRTSALRFRGDHPLALIGPGSGYWRYIPTGGGVRFLTGYDYRPAWGRPGRLADLAFRPLMGWATAWSFDRLRLWLEHGVSPERARFYGLAEAVARTATIALAAAIALASAATLAGPAATMRGPVGAAIGGTIGGMVAAAALLLPPSPRTPAARRCRRRPPDRRAATPPSTLELLPSAVLEPR